MIGLNLITKFSDKLLMLENQRQKITQDAYQCCYYNKIIVRTHSMDPSISIEYQKTALQLKYLLSLRDKVTEEQTLEILNKLYPFTLYPLKKVPPIQYFEYQPGFVITPNLREIVQSYSLIIILGKCKIQKQIYAIDEQRYIDQTIKDRLVYNFDQGETELRAINTVKLLKVHNIWIKKAKQANQNEIKEYIKAKLLKIPFFYQLSFEEFNKICEKSQLKSLGPGEPLLNQNSTPYHMYIVTEGQLSIRKQVNFNSQHEVWRQVQISSQKRNEYCQELFQYLVREPLPEAQIFSVHFLIKTVGEGTILCATQTLNQTPISYSIVSTLKSKYISIKYPDLYILQQSRLLEIRSWPLFSVDKKQLRRQYYYELNWQDYKKYLTEDQILTSMQSQNFYDFLRKQVSLSIKKYNYSNHKIGQGYLTDSPAQKMFRVKKMTYRQHQA